MLEYARNTLPVLREAPPMPLVGDPTSLATISLKTIEVSPQATSGPVSEIVEVSKPKILEASPHPPSDAYQGIGAPAYSTARYGLFLKAIGTHDAFMSTKYVAGEMTSPEIDPLAEGRCILAVMEMGINNDDNGCVAIVERLPSNRALTEFYVRLPDNACFTGALNFDRHFFGGFTYTPECWTEEQNSKRTLSRFISYGSGTLVVTQGSDGKPLATITDKSVAGGWQIPLGGSSSCWEHVSTPFIPYPPLTSDVFYSFGTVARLGIQSEVDFFERQSIIRTFLFMTYNYQDVPLPGPPMTQNPRRCTKPSRTISVSPATTTAESPGVLISHTAEPQSFITTVPSQTGSSTSIASHATVARGSPQIELSTVIEPKPSSTGIFPSPSWRSPPVMSDERVSPLSGDTSLNMAPTAGSGQGSQKLPPASFLILPTGLSSTGGDELPASFPNVDSTTLGKKPRPFPLSTSIVAPNRGTILAPSSITPTNATEARITQIAVSPLPPTHTPLGTSRYISVPSVTLSDPLTIKPESKAGVSPAPTDVSISTAKSRTTDMSWTRIWGHGTWTLHDHTTTTDLPRSGEGPPKVNVTVPSVEPITYSGYLIGLLVPIILATLLSIFIQVLRSNVQAILPFVILENGARAPNSVTLVPGGMFGLWTDIRLLLTERKALPILSDSMGIFCALITALSTSTVSLGRFGYCRDSIRCYMGLGYYSMTLKIAEGFLVAIAIQLIPTIISSIDCGWGCFQIRGWWGI